MVTDLLVVDSEADFYRGHLSPLFPDVNFLLAPDGDAAAEYLPAAEILFSIARWLTPERLAACKKLKWIQCNITGTDHLTDVLKARPDILLTNGRGIHGPQMSEITVLHMMAMYRQVGRLARNQRDHVWERFLPRVLDNRVAVILGVGAIAGHLAGVLKAFGMTVHGISGSPRDVPNFDRIYGRDELLQAAGEADFFIVLVPFTPENDKIVNADVFEAMKPTAMLVNVARGGVVDEAALIDALDSGKISGAGLDVFETAPLPDNSPLWDMENVFITPFTGGRSDQYEQNLLTIQEPNLRAYLAGERDKMINIVSGG